MTDPFWGNPYKNTGSEGKGLLPILRKIPIFEQLSEKELKKVETICYERHFNKDEEIFKEGAPGVGMFIIKEGAVKIARGQKELAQLSEGDFFGEVALLDESPRTATAVASEKATLLGIFRPDLLDLVKRDPWAGSKILLKLSELMGKRLRAANEKLKDVL